MAYFRDNTLTFDVKEKLDYKKGIDDLPKSDVLKFILEDGSWIAVRPSGTEPKIKFYFGVNSNNEVETEEKLSKLMESMTNMVDSI